MGQQPVAGRTPPHSSEAEEGLLACILIDGAESLAAAANAGIGAASFYEPAHRTIFETAERMALEGSPIDQGILAQELLKAGMLDAIGGYAAINRLTDNIPTTAHRDYYVQQIRAMEGCRNVITLATRSIEAAYQFQGAPEELRGTMTEVLAKFSSPNGAPRNMAQISDQVHADITEEIAGRKKRGTIATGIPSLDRICGLFEPGEMIVLGARPSIGKTSLALQIAKKAAEMDQRTLLFSLEMDECKLFRVAAAQKSGISQTGLERAHQYDQQKYLQAVKDLRTLRALQIYNHRYSSFARIVGTVRAERLKGKIGLIVIDYLQLIEAVKSGGYQNREQVIATISRTMKNLAGDAEAPLLVLAQLNRGPESDGREPRKADLRESGSIEQDADRVLLLHRPSEGRDGEQQADDADNLDARLIVDKHRCGPTGRFWLRFNRPSQTFTELAKQASETP
jgi:replicative DNA helicase